MLFTNDTMRELYFKWRLTHKLPYMFICLLHWSTSLIASLFWKWLAFLITHFCRWSMIRGDTISGTEGERICKSTVGRYGRAATAALWDLDLMFKWHWVITGSTFHFFLTLLFSVRLQMLLIILVSILSCVLWMFLKFNFQFTYISISLSAI